eukprot:GHVQ01006019.1.p3 GENE.GHVQ01006019.1~~GHVQ01006019.1.p3  ORF type:complete len:358 (-),score=74.86 GHVQ01006019.1:378-1451(-)
MNVLVCLRHVRKSPHTDQHTSYNNKSISSICKMSKLSAFFEKKAKKKPCKASTLLNDLNPTTGVSSSSIPGSSSAGSSGIASVCADRQAAGKQSPEQLEEDADLAEWGVAVDTVKTDLGNDISEALVQKIGMVDAATVRNRGDKKNLGWTAAELGLEQPQEESGDGTNIDEGESAETEQQTECVDGGDGGSAPVAASSEPASSTSPDTKFVPPHMRSKSGLRSLASRGPVHLHLDKDPELAASVRLIQQKQQPVSKVDSKKKDKGNGAAGEKRKAAIGGDNWEDEVGSDAEGTGEEMRKGLGEGGRVIDMLYLFEKINLDMKVPIGFEDRGSVAVDDELVRTKFEGRRKPNFVVEAV